MAEETLKDKLINKLKEINDPVILEEVSNLFELQESVTVYQTTAQQKKSIEEAKSQVNNKVILTDKQAEKDINKWLNK